MGHYLDPFILSKNRHIRDETEKSVAILWPFLAIFFANYRARATITSSSLETALEY